MKTVFAQDTDTLFWYMARDEFHVGFGLWHDMLAPEGRIVLSDLISLAYPSSLYLFDVLRFSARTAVLVRALAPR